MSTTTPLTADQLLRTPDDGYRYELIRGELRRMSLRGWVEGAIGGCLGGWIGRHAEDQQLGQVFLAGTGFLLAEDPDTVRAPAIAFIHKDHFPAQFPKEAFWPGAPDLAVEMISPDDKPAEVAEKARAWLAAGTQMV